MNMVWLNNVYVLQLIVARGLPKFCSHGRVLQRVGADGCQCPQGSAQTAPEVSSDYLVESMEQGLGTHTLMHYSKGSSPLVVGWDIFCKGKKITYEVLELTKDLLTSLTKDIAIGIWQHEL